MELRAMALARMHYEQAGWTVEDVSAKRSYDLACRRGDQTLRVEVKGTTGLGDLVLLTKNEVSHARNQHPNVALFIVHGIKLTRDTPPEATEGKVLMLDPWDVEQGQLEPLAFSYLVPRT